MSQDPFAGSPVPIPSPEPFPGPFPGPVPPPGPGPVPMPGPFPEPDRPVPLPPDWDFWRCWRRRGLSGRYQGVQARGLLFGRTLELRVDIDRRYNAESPVMNRLSGDFFSTRIVSLGGALRVIRTYVESWIVDAPVVRWARCSVHVSGSVRFWQGAHPATTLELTIPWSMGAIGSGTAVFTTGGMAGQPFSLSYVSDTFRDVSLEIDYCASVDVEPRVPEYGTLWHANRPADTADRTLTIESAYREAGIGVTTDPTHTVIDDSVAAFTSWSPGELHDAMETAFSRFTGTWPAWNLWGLQAGLFDDDGVGGIMFDAAAGFGGAGEAPERQGFAVFRDHEWFTNLAPGAPANQDQAWAMRHFLYTWVHEAGHAFNFLHSWNKSRPSSLSWMNYDWKYDQINGADTFWAGFRFRFDDEELIHIRHGDRAAVIMGGDPWASGGHLEAPSATTLLTEPGGTLELLLRGKDHFDFMEPVELEFRLRNLTGLPLAVDARLDPRYGTTTVFVQRPDGTRAVFDSIFCLYGTPESVELGPAASEGGQEGPDRVSVLVPLTYGVGGFTFDSPGTYLVRAVYHGAGFLETSNTLRVFVGYPTTKAEDRFASEFFTREVGLTLALDGSMSPYLEKGLDTLTEASERFAEEPLGAKASTAVARSVGDDFFRQKEHKLVKHHNGDPKRALQVTAPALESYEQAATPEQNLEYAQLVKIRAGLHVEAGEAQAASREVSTLATHLEERGANSNVVQAVKALAPTGGAKRPARKRTSK